MAGLFPALSAQETNILLHLIIACAALVWLGMTILPRIAERNAEKRLRKYRLG
jgi:hypothetical protein